MKIITKIAAGALVALAFVANTAVAHQTTGDPFPHTHSNKTRTIVGEIYTPTIWIDPDGCEHWVMDDGWEGFMTPKLDRQGRPTCHGYKANVCGVLSSDTLFATDSYHLNGRARAAVQNFFASNRAGSYALVGHTDSRASDGYNLRLSQNRANAVARYAQSLGVRITSATGAGERQPIASNGTRHGMAKNRRVEIMCVN